MEPSGKLSVISSTNFFEDPLQTSVVTTGVTEFEKKGDFLFAVRDNADKEEEKRLFLAKVGDRFVEAVFPTSEPLRDFHVCEVTDDGQIIVIVNHSIISSRFAYVRIAAIRIIWCYHTSRIISFIIRY